MTQKRCFYINLMLTIALFAFTETSFSQSSNREVVTQDAEWFQINSYVKLTKHIGLPVDVQLRFSDFESAQHMIRIGVDIPLTKALSIVPIGYARIWNYSYGEQPSSLPADEKRTWEQVLVKHKVWKMNIQHRFRLEQRFIENVYLGNSGEEVHEGYDIHRGRFRYRFLFWAPFKGEKIEPKHLFWGGMYEGFVSWGEGVSFHKIDQNRFHLGTGYQINKKAQFIIGPWYQMLIKKNGTQQENNVGIMMWFNYNFDFSKQDK